MFAHPAPAALTHWLLRPIRLMKQLSRPCLKACSLLHNSTTRGAECILEAMLPLPARRGGIHKSFAVGPPLRSILKLNRIAANASLPNHSWTGIGEIPLILTFREHRHISSSRELAVMKRTSHSEAFFRVANRANLSVRRSASLHIYSKRRPSCGRLLLNTIYM